MTSAQLSDKAVDIKGRKYILVSDRILYFSETYPNGSISTELISEPDADMVVMRTTVTPDVANPLRKFTGYSQATWGQGFINKTSALENCETSSAGRALGLMGIGVIDSIASVDEINKAQTYQPKRETPINSLLESINRIESLPELTTREDKFLKNMELFSEDQQKKIKEAFLTKSVALEENES